MTTDDQDCPFNSFTRYQSAQVSSPLCSIHNEAAKRYLVHPVKSTDERHKWKYYDEVRASTAAVKSRWPESQEHVSDGG
jgi:hypothetical protein